MEPLISFVLAVNDDWPLRHSRHSPPFWTLQPMPPVINHFYAWPMTVMNHQPQQDMQIISIYWWWTVILPSSWTKNRPILAMPSHELTADRNKPSLQTATGWATAWLRSTGPKRQPTAGGSKGRCAVQAVAVEMLMRHLCGLASAGESVGQQGFMMSSGASMMVKVMGMVSKQWS